MNYKSIASDSRSEIIINRSRFISRAAPVESEEQALSVLASERSRYPDATHHCYAYVLGYNALLTRHSDDGEPSGTAGLPILDVIKNKGLTNTIVVVTRYFGGVLLGTGGLVRAYSQSAIEAIGQSGIIQYTLCAIYGFEVDYPTYSKIERSRIEINITETEFSGHVTFKAAIPVSVEEQQINKIVDICGGLVEYKRLSEAFYPI